MREMLSPVFYIYFACVRCYSAIAADENVAIF